MSSANTVPVDIKKTDYTVDYEYGPSPIMHLIGRAPGGNRVHLYSDEPDPYFYVPEEQFDSDLENHDYVRKCRRGHKNIQGQRMVKVYTRIPGDVPKIREDYDHHEADILFPNRFLIDSGIRGAVEVPRRFVSKEPQEINFDRLESTDYSNPSRICFCDIEVDDGDGFPDAEIGDKEVVCITVCDSFTREYQAFLYHPDLPDVSHEFAKVRIFPTETDMWKGFINYLLTHEPDVLAGWNFSDFDARYMVNRLEYIANSDDFGFDEKEDEELNKNSISPLGTAYDDGWFGAKIKGIAVFDMLMAYKNQQFTDLNSYALEEVSQEVLGEGKVKDSRSIRKQWEEDPQKLIEYNIRDVELLQLLEDNEDIIKFYEEVANYVGGRLSEMIDPSNAVDIEVLRQVNSKYAVPSAKTGEEFDFEGAEVFDPIVGVRENVAVFDLASLYPMSMKTINAGPETKDPDGDIVAPNGVRFSSEEDAEVVEIIDRLLEERDKKKKQRDRHPAGSREYKKFDRQQAAIKVIMNTLYGVSGWERFRLTDEDVAASITAVGREVLEFTERVLNEMGYDVLYGDTDSVMIEFGSDVSREEILEIGFEIEKRINEKYDEFAKEVLNVDEHFFEIEFEKLYRRYLQAGKKKRYAGHIVWKEGKDVDDVDIVGFEFKRSDYSKVAKEIQEKVMNELVRGGTLEDISEYVQETISKLKDMEYEPEEFGVPQGISKNFDDYEAETMAVRGSRYANEEFGENIQPGDKPKGMYIKKILPNDQGFREYPMPAAGSEKTPFICWMNFDNVPEEFVFDWDEYIRVQIKDPLKRILEATEWTWDEVVTGVQRKKLDEYEFEDQVSSSDSEAVKAVPVDGNGSKFDDFDTDDLSGTELQRMEARQRIIQTQQFLDKFDDEDTEVEETKTVKFTQPENGQPKLEEYLD